MEITGTCVEKVVVVTGVVVVTVVTVGGEGDGDAIVVEGVEEDMKVLGE